MKFLKRFIKPSPKKEILTKAPWDKFNAKGIDYEALVIEHLNEHTKKIINQDIQFKRVPRNDGIVLFEADIVHDGYDKFKLELRYNYLNYYMSSSESSTTDWYSLHINGTSYHNVYRALLNDDSYYRIHYDMNFIGDDQSKMFTVLKERMKKFYDLNIQVLRDRNTISLVHFPLNRSNHQIVMKITQNPLRNTYSFEYDLLDAECIFTAHEDHRRMHQLAEELFQDFPNPEESELNAEKEYQETEHNIYLRKVYLKEP